MCPYHPELCMLMLAEAHALERGRLCDGAERGRAESARKAEAARLRHDVARMMDRNGALCLAAVIWLFARIGLVDATSLKVPFVPLSSWFKDGGPFSVGAIGAIKGILERKYPAPVPTVPPRPPRVHVGPPLLISFGDGEPVPFDGKDKP